ncbi:MAG: ATP-binding protein [Bacteroidota bacterium]
MPPKIINQEKYAVAKSVLRYCGVAFCIAIAASCKQKRSQSVGVSDNIKHIVKQIDVLFSTNHPLQALQLADSVRLHSDLTLDEQYNLYRYHYFYYQKILGDNRKAVPYADTLLTIANKSINEKQYVALSVDANFALGDAYFSLQKYNDAYRHLFQAYITGKNSFNKVVLADYMYRMGMITYKMGDYRSAKDYFIKAHQYFDFVKTDFVSFYHVQELLDNVALSYKHNGQPDSAIIYFDRSLVFINKYGPYFTERPNMIDIARAVVYGNKAEIFLAKKDNPEAIALLKKSIEINLQKGNDNNDAALSEIKLAQIYYDTNKDQELSGLLTAMNTQMDSLKNPAVEADWNQLMSKYYTRTNQLVKALAHLQKYSTLKDSVAKKLYLLKESDIHNQLDSFEKQQQIEQLSNNNKIQRIQLWVSIVIAIMALIIILLIYRNWKRSKEDVQTVKILNQQINQQNLELEIALNDLKAKSQEKDHILRTVAHDLRNPIGGIVALTGLIDNENCTDEQQELIALIKETSRNSLELINEILEATNITSIQLQPEPVEINALVSKSVELLRFKASEKRQKIFYEPLNAPLNLQLSREKIWRVISNLISNAIKFSANSSPIFVKVTKEKEEVIISVLDNGIGIPDNLKDHVFNMFTIAQRPGTAGEKSFGLGLFICKQIIEKSNGKIWFTSSKSGTVFYISLPLSASVK